jgi:hypothetical protein
MNSFLPLRRQWQPDPADPGGHDGGVRVRLHEPALQLQKAVDSNLATHFAYTISPTGDRFAKKDLLNFSGAVGKLSRSFFANRSPVGEMVYAKWLAVVANAGVPSVTVPVPLL